MNQIDLTEKEQMIAQLLINYMQKNPDAKHTAEGIARWWIMQQRFEDEMELIEKVLCYLTQREILEEVILAQDQKYYKINKGCLNKTA